MIESMSDNPDMMLEPVKKTGKSAQIMKQSLWLMYNVPYR